MTAPFLIVFAGPNGSGKSTLVGELIARGIDLGIHINPDEIAKTLHGSYEARVSRAQSLADLLRERCIAEKRSFSFETVMSHPSKIDVMQQARDAGFEVTLYFIGLCDPALNIERVATRVAQGGHDVPADRIVARYARTMNLLAKAVRAAHQSVVFDNSSVGDDSGVWLHPIVEIENYKDSVICKPVSSIALPSWVDEYLLSRL
jgi:predicted ABC-type ATPase